MRAWGHPDDDRRRGFVEAVEAAQRERGRELALDHRRALVPPPPLEHVPSYEELAEWRADRAAKRAERRELEARRRTQQVVAGIVLVAASPFVGAIVHHAAS